MLERDLLEHLDRRSLQRLAKQHGVKANLKSAAIIDELTSLEAHPGVSEEQPNPLLASNKAESQLVLEDAVLHDKTNKALSSFQRQCSLLSEQEPGHHDDSTRCLKPGATAATHASMPRQASDATQHASAYAHSAPVAAPVMPVHRKSSSPIEASAQRMRASARYNEAPAPQGTSQPAADMHRQHSVPEAQQVTPPGMLHTEARAWQRAQRKAKQSMDLSRAPPRLSGFAPAALDDARSSGHAPSITPETQLQPPPSPSPRSGPRKHQANRHEHSDSTPPNGAFRPPRSASESVDAQPDHRQGPHRVVAKHGPPFAFHHAQRSRSVAHGPGSRRKTVRADWQNGSDIAEPAQHEEGIKCGSMGDWRQSLRTAHKSSSGAKGRSKSACNRQARPAGCPEEGTDDSELASCLASIRSEVLVTSPQLKWSDIAGLETTKQLLQESVVLPSLRPDIFTGLRAPARGVLLFGPPGTGKTLLAKAVATEAKATFFNMSASSLTSKYVGRAEKMVRALFQVAEECSPSIVFLDEMDSVLGSRGGTEHESSRRLKTEFLTRFDGLACSEGSSRVIVIGATNRPQDLDDAVRRRLARRVYVPLPDMASRAAMLRLLLSSGALPTNLTDSDFEVLAQRLDGYSGSDIASLCQEAAMRPVREVARADLPTIDEAALRLLDATDVEAAMSVVRPSVPPDTLQSYACWNDMFGSDVSQL